MTKTEMIRNEMMKAMKEKNKERKDTLSMLLNALKNAEIDKRDSLTESESDVVIKKEIKQLKETYDTVPDSREDIKKEAAARIEICKEFVSADMSEAEIESVILNTIKEIGVENPTMKDKGRIMKVLMPKVKGKADGKVVNEILQKILN